ncbi:MAG: hypothetical protein ACTSXD_11685 [Candidatus Heimdallarchaeaceae archaeon]
MGNVYVKEVCPRCRRETWHRIVRRFGHSGDRWHLRRMVTTCQNCGYRVIENSRARRMKKVKGIISFRGKE